MTIDLLKIIFDLPIRFHEIPLFKKELLHLQNPKQDVWHNHVHDMDELDQEKSFKLIRIKEKQANFIRYPKIQFRAERVKTKTYASVWAIGEGVSTLKEFIDICTNYKIPWYNTSYQLAPGYIGVIDDFKIELFNDLRLNEYSLTHFLPFNEDRYKQFKSLRFFDDKLKLIEQMILQNLYVFFESFNVQIPEKFAITVKTLDVKGFNTVKYKPKNSDETLSYVAVDLLVGINALLPPEISLGNLKALGYGILRPLQSKGFHDD
jgi:hypothetical protein